MNRKRTKIIATLADKHCEPDFIKSLFEAGMNIVRINSAHCDVEGALKLIRNTRAVSDRIAILIDTKGPEIRTTVCDAPINLEKGDLVLMTGEIDKKTENKCINVSYKAIADEVPVGSLILIDDGELELKVLQKKGNSLECSIENSGILGSRKSVNIPGVRIHLPSLTEKDRKFIKMAIAEDLDFIAHSFVRSKKDVQDVQAILDEAGSKIKIIAKIENQEGVDNIDEILDSVYGVMVARGDLAIEVPFERIPALQRMLIDRCIKRRKPVIVATQMLHSMIQNPRPTRAEVSDVANAIYYQTDAVMLSGETASGKYPVEAVKTMSKIALETEMNKEPYLEIPAGNIAGEISSYLAKVAVKTSLRIGARGIIADTAEGKTIRDMAAYRGRNLILARCYSKRAVRELALSYGVYANYQEKLGSADEFIRLALTSLIDSHDLRDEDIMVILAGNFSGGSGFSFIEAGTVSYLKDRVSIRF